MNLSLPANMSDLSAWGLILARAPSLAESITYHESMFKTALQFIYTALEVNLGAETSGAMSMEASCTTEE